MVFELLDDLPISNSYKVTLRDIKISISKGETLEASFKRHKKYYPNFFIQTLALGEEYGSLNKVLEEIEKIYLKQYSINEKVISSSIYPLFILGALLILSLGLILFGIPIFYDIYSNMNIEIPGVCESLNVFSVWLKSNPILSILYLFCYIGFLPVLICRFVDKEKLKGLLVKNYIYRIYMEYMSLMYLSLLFKSGISLQRGLDVCIENTDDMFLKQSFITIRDSINRGESLYDAVSSIAFYSKYSRALIKIGEESGSLDERLNFACNYVEGYVFKSIDGTVKMLQPMTIFIMGGFIGLFIIFIVLPLFSSLYGGI